MSEQSILTLIILFCGPTMLGGLLLDRLRESQRKRRWNEAEALRIQREKELAAETTRKAEEVVRATFSARMNGLGLDRLDELEAFQHSAEGKLSLQEQLLISATNEAKIATAEAARIKTQVEKLSGALEVANSTIAELKNTIDRLEASLQANNEVTEEQSVEIERNRAHIIELESRIKEVETERDNLRAQNAAHLSTIEALQAQVDTLIRELEEYKLKVDLVEQKQENGHANTPQAGDSADAPFNVNVINLPNDPKQDNSQASEPPEGSTLS